MPSLVKANQGSTTKGVVVAINGFLGRPQDWSLIEGLIPEGWSFEAIDVWGADQLPKFAEWAKQTNESISAKYPAERKILLGYSMGGRLALHALIQSPKLYEGALIVSANPGLASDDERKLRLQADEIWAHKFTREPWTKLMMEWNAQAALRAPIDPSPDAVSLRREESDFNRGALSHSLQTWSLGAQTNLRAEISNLSMPIAFVTGSSDVKFSSIAQDLVKIPAHGPRVHVVVPHAGHRVPWDAPSQFRAVLAEFLARW